MDKTLKKHARDLALFLLLVIIAVLLTWAVSASEITPGLGINTGNPNDLNDGSRLKPAQLGLLVSHLMNFGPLKPSVLAPGITRSNRPFQLNGSGSSSTKSLHPSSVDTFNRLLGWRKPIRQSF